MAAAQRALIRLNPLPPNLSDLEIQIFLSKDYVSKPTEELKQRPAQERISIASSLITKLIGTADPIIEIAEKVKREAESELRASNPFGHARKVPQASPIGATADRIEGFPMKVAVGGKKKKTQRLKKKSRRRV